MRHCPKAASRQSHHVSHATPAQRHYWRIESSRPCAVYLGARQPAPWLNFGSAFGSEEQSPRKPGQPVFSKRHPSLPTGKVKVRMGFPYCHVCASGAY
jgi:hypothetical protein